MSNAGSLLALYSDGITEAVDAEDEEFGPDRLLSILLENVERPVCVFEDRRPVFEGQSGLLDAGVVEGCFDLPPSALEQFNGLGDHHVVGVGDVGRGQSELGFLL